MSQTDKAEELRQRAETIRREMGGQDKIDRIHAAGRLTIRERIDRLLDPGSFFEIGTFARSERVEDRTNSPGDGKIGGLGRIDGRPVAVTGDDITVKRGSSSVVGSRRVRRIFQTAMKDGHPIVNFGETGGARIPDTLGAEGFVKVTPDLENAQRARCVPMLSVICGESFGGSSFQSAFSDIVIQTKGTCLAVTSPRVIEIATGEKIAFEDLGGTATHEKITGQIDLTAEDEEDAIRLVREVLSYLPQNAWEVPARMPWDGKLEANERLREIVPERRTRAYDMRHVLRHLTDNDTILELKPQYGRSLITALGRIAGVSVGFIASQPTYYAGALSPEACDKATAFTCFCDAFNIPLIFLQDTPGFMVGKHVEHHNLLARAIRFLEALGQCQVPRFTIVLRKAFGLAYFSLGGSRMGAHGLAAWPGAEISFMDPQVGVNVVHAGRLAKAEDPDAERARLIGEWTRDTGPEGAAGTMEIDEIIDPADTRVWLATHLDRLRIQPPPWGQRKPLAWWPTCY